jgi:hypothetical protein
VQAPEFLNVISYDRLIRCVIACLRDAKQYEVMYKFCILTEIHVTTSIPLHVQPGTVVQIYDWFVYT